MSTQVQLRRGDTAQNDAFTGAVGEVSIDTTEKRIRVHDGATAGGSEHALKSEVQTAQGTADAALASANAKVFLFPLIYDAYYPDGAAGPISETHEIIVRNLGFNPNEMLRVSVYLKLDGTFITAGTIKAELTWNDALGGAASTEEILATTPATGSVAFANFSSTIAIQGIAKIAITVSALTGTDILVCDSWVTVEKLAVL